MISLTDCRIISNAANVHYAVKSALESIWCIYFLMIIAFDKAVSAIIMHAIVALRKHSYKVSESVKAQILGRVGVWSITIQDKDVSIELLLLISMIASTC